MIIAGPVLPRRLMPAQPCGHRLVRMPRSRRSALYYCQIRSQATELPLQHLQPTVFWWRQVRRHEVEQVINDCLTGAHLHLMGKLRLKFLDATSGYTKELVVLAFAGPKTVAIWFKNLQLSSAFQAGFLDWRPLVPSLHILVLEPR